MQALSKKLIIAAIACFSATGVILADTYDLSWYTIDGGGGMNSTGGGFTLSGTIGQPDAGSFAAPLTGGNFTLVGGFWSAMNTCSMPGDVNLDGRIDGRDIQFFVNCITGNGGACICADMDGGGIAPSDIAPFISTLLAP